ncbi:GATOR complex protein NPRL2-like isoform X2 [Ostrea edulis]|uniref:GATOR complex protein NPRL2-like isoform X2 n=1 Tax=Ostrea edulis TaxID=37623 RepID=UPI0024AFD75D|nr:GATOR complex protein NPRL2-like isoform X2 [Ostrea edulis]
MVPREIISKAHFDIIHNYIIPKPEFQGRLITVNALGYKIVGCPVYIGDTKYQRNALMFNLCFVFGQSVDTSNHEPVVKKLASYLTQIELESGFLSSKKSQEHIPVFMEKVLHLLNKYGCCSIPVGESITVHLKVPVNIVEPLPVQDHAVPIIIRDRLMQHNEWDLTTQQVLPYIDGFNPTCRIAVEADVEINLVKSCLQNLLHYNIIKIIPVFQYSNMYTVTSDIKKLFSDVHLQEQCMHFVAIKGRTLPRLRDILTLYTSMTHGVTVKDLCCRYNPHGLKIDEKKLIQFGVVKNLIRVLRKFPIKVPSNIDPDPRLRSLYPMFDGLRCYDEICCKVGIGQADLEDRIENDPSVTVCVK